MATAAQLLNNSVYRHRIMWTDLADRVALNEGISKDSAAELVAPLVAREACSLAVAAALIELIVEKGKLS